MNLNISNFNFNYQMASKRVIHPTFLNRNKIDDTPPKSTKDFLITDPAQLSLLHMHDFHGQNIRMERAYSAVRQFDSGKLANDDDIFDKNLPIDRFKLCSGDIFLGENEIDLKVVNKFLNISEVLANVLGNHECDMETDDFAEIVQDRSYKFLGANMHPDDDSEINSIISDSFIIESNGNKYGIIGLVPVDMANHMKRPDDIEEFNISDFDDTIEDLEDEVEKLRNKGANKIILLSHLGFQLEQFIAEHVSDIDIILGGHTHNLIKEAKDGYNLLKSPKNEPVLIVQVGRDGEYIGLPNVKFNEFGQITDVQYNIVKTDSFPRNIVAKSSFENILGKPEIVGKVSYAEEPPKDIYARENPHCNFIMDCLRDELNTDIAIMNSANIRGRFYEGNVDTRDLMIISPFANKVTVIEATEAEIVESFNDIIESTTESPVHRPGIFQVSGLKYTYSESKGKLTELYFIDKYGNEHPIDIKKPSKKKIYTIAVDDYCVTSKKSGLNLKHRYDDALEKYDYDKDFFVARYLRKHKEPINVKSDGRIKVVD